MAKESGASYRTRRSERERRRHKQQEKATESPMPRVRPADLSSDTKVARAGPVPCG